MELDTSMQYKWTALTVTILGTLTSGLASRIIIIGLPTISAELHAGAAEVTWVGQAYLLATTVLVLVIGKISDVYGRVKLYNIGFLFFTLGSILAAISANLNQLMVLMVMQGVCAAILTTNTVTIITDASPTNELGRFLGISQTAYRFGSIIAFTAGGIILTYLNWRGLFYPNIIIGLVGTALGYKKLKELSLEETNRKLDWLGFILFVLGLLLVLISITYLSYGLSNVVQGTAMLGIGLVIILLFFKAEQRSTNPLLDLNLLKIRIFASNNLAMLLNAVTWGAILLLLSLYLQIGLGHSPLYTGLALVPLDIVYLFSTVIFGNLSDKYGTRLFCTLGLVITALSFLVTSLFNASTSYPEILASMCIIGLGNGMFSSPNMSAIMNSVPSNRRGVSSGFLNAMFGVGFTISYGLTILFITFGIRYSVLSSLVQHNMPGPLLPFAQIQFFNGFHICALILTVISLIAAIPASLKPNITTNQP